MASDWPPFSRSTRALPPGLCTAHREEDHVGRSPYQSEKRRKELARLKKQEEKRQRRFNKKHEGEKAPEQPSDAPPGAEPGMADAAGSPPAPTQPEVPEGGKEPGQL